MYMVHKSDTSNPKPKLPPTKKPPAKKQKAQYKILFLTTYDSILTTNPSSVFSTLASLFLVSPLIALSHFLLLKAA